jgi:outer membrane lipoprotein-sorting protein
MSKRLLTVILALAVMLPAASFADSRPSGTLAKVMTEVAKKQKSVRTLEARFRQEKEMALLAKPEVSTGTFTYAAPNEVLWKYESPKPVVMLISKGWLTTYYPSLHKAEKLEIKRYQDRIFRYMAASAALDELGKYFNFTFIESKKDPFYQLELTPKTKVVARRVKRIKIWIDRTTYLTSKFEYVEGDGDLTRYEFSDIRVNGAVSPAVFALNLPPSVKVEQIKVQ